MNQKEKYKKMTLKEIDDQIKMFIYAKASTLSQGVSTEAIDDKLDALFKEKEKRTKDGVTENNENKK